MDDDLIRDDLIELRGRVGELERLDLRERIDQLERQVNLLMRTVNTLALSTPPKPKDGK